MKRCFIWIGIFIPLILSRPSICHAQEDKRLLVMFWNLENFFDYLDSGMSDSDREFSSAGKRRWTRSRFYTKCNAVAKTLLWMGDRYGRLPDVIGMAEIENRYVLNALIGATALRKYDYCPVHYESHDSRGIDVALLYRSSVFANLGSEVFRTGSGEMWKEVSGGIPEFSSRDILHVTLGIDGGHGRKIHFLVNHHPSKYGGEKESLPKRNAVMKLLKHICDSIIRSGGTDVVAMGDFNDTPDSRTFRILDTVMYNKAYGICGNGEGTIKYDGKWDLIDMFMVSPGQDSLSKMEICRIPFLLTDDKAYSGKKPLRTYSGPKYNGGISDHLPIVLHLKL